MERPASTLASTLVFGLALVLFVLGTPSGSWDAAAGHASLAAHHDHLAAAPLYGAIAGAVADLPFGEVGFRLGILGAVLGALTLAGVVAAARAWLPKDPVAGVVGAVLLALAPPFRDAVAFANPAILAACGVTWAIAASIDRRAVVALAWVGVVVGSSPWLGVALAVVVVGWLATRRVDRKPDGGRARSGAEGGAEVDRKSDGRRSRSGAEGGAEVDHRVLALAIAALGALSVVLWATAIGPFPSLSPSFGALIAASAQGAAAVVIGSGLLGIAFGAATGLPSARGVGLVVIATAAAAIAADPSPAPLLAVLAIGVAVIPSAIVRAVSANRRELVVVGAGVPLVVMALLVGPALGVDDPRGAPSRLATDLVGALPPGPGAIVLTRGTPWSAVSYEKAVAGARPDLALAPLMPPLVADAVVVRHLRGNDIVGSDVPALGRLDPLRAVPRGRGFQLQLGEAAVAVPPPPPASYASDLGEQQAVTLALTRARYEAGSGRLDAAARAAGLTSRFRAADLAVLSTSVPTRERPALYGFVPRFSDEPARVRLDLFGDDLAWVARLEQPVATAPRSRRLHALWREVLSGTRMPNDPEIVALGAEAIAATAELLAAVGNRP